MAQELFTTAGRATRPDSQPLLRRGCCRPTGGMDHALSKFYERQIREECQVLSRAVNVLLLTQGPSRGSQSHSTAFLLYPRILSTEQPSRRPAQRGRGLVMDSACCLGCVHDLC